MMKNFALDNSSSAISNRPKHVIAMVWYSCMATQAEGSGIINILTVLNSILVICF